MEVQTTSNVPPEDCGHKRWTLGCGRCFHEMETLAGENITISNRDTLIKGAVLFNWHIVTIIHELISKLEHNNLHSLDLSEVRVAKDLITNMSELARYFVQLASDDRRLMEALQNASILVEELQKRMHETAEPAKSSLVITDAA